MCGRYALHSSPEVIRLQFGLRSLPAFPPRYNIAPTAQVLMVRKDGAALARWGIGAKLFNARVETLAMRPAFRDAYRKRRCLIPANGFYEWKALPRGKQPYYVRSARGELFAFAGLWDSDACTIITTDANAALRNLHGRMPAIIAPADYARWLDGADDLLHPAPDDAVFAYPVGDSVSQAALDTPQLIEPADSTIPRRGATGELFGD